MENKEFINHHGLFATIITAIIGVPAFSYPRELASTVGTDGWIIALVEGIIWFLIIYLTYRVIEINDYGGFYNIITNNFGKILGFIISIFFIIYNLMFISLQMRMFTEVLKMYLLEKTPTEFILIVTILVGTYMIRSSVDDLVKFNEIALWIMIFAAIFIMIFSLNKADFTNVLPVLSNTPADYIKAIQATIYSFTGLQVIYLICPFVKNKKDIPKTALKSIGFVTIFYALIVIFTLAVLTKDQSKIMLWPTISMVKCINIPGALMERWDGIIMSLWVIFYFTSFANICYLVSDITKDTLKLGNIKFSPIIIAPLIYCMAIYYPNIADVNNALAKVNSIFGFISLILLPLLLYFISGFKHKKKKVVNR